MNPVLHVVVVIDIAVPPDVPSNATTGDVMLKLLISVVSLLQSRLEFRTYKRDVAQSGRLFLAPNTILASSATLTET